MIDMTYSNDGDKFYAIIYTALETATKIHPEGEVLDEGHVIDEGIEDWMHVCEVILKDEYFMRYPKLIKKAKKMWKLLDGLKKG